GIQQSFEVSQNYPNPFNSRTKIGFIISEAGLIRIRLLNILGEIIRTIRAEVMQPGEYSIDLDLTEHPSGVYFYQIQSTSKSITRKLSFLK
ncbi:MAG TPA: T9SS type A sorting domain-containing protein, partial [Bacteroidota bacterium]|nr:T9SS type A sorting domain-containing protein [Bacteroidota bacterium]